MIQNDKSVGEIIAEAREKGISKRELSRLANISDIEFTRIGERETPNPKTLRKIINVSKQKVCDEMIEDLNMNHKYILDKM